MIISETGLARAARRGPRPFYTRSVRTHLNLILKCYAFQHEKIAVFEYLFLCILNSCFFFRRPGLHSKETPSYSHVRCSRVRGGRCWLSAIRRPSRIAGRAGSADGSWPGRCRLETRCWDRPSISSGRGLRCFSSHTPTKNGEGGLGAPPSALLLGHGMIALGCVCVPPGRGSGMQGAFISSLAEFRSRVPGFPEGRRAERAVLGLVVWLRERGVDPCKPERPRCFLDPRRGAPARFGLAPRDAGYPYRANRTDRRDGSRRPGGMEGVGTRLARGASSR